MMPARISKCTILISEIIKGYMRLFSLVFFCKFHQERTHFHVKEKLTYTVGWIDRDSRQDSRQSRMSSSVIWANHHNLILKTKYTSLPTPPKRCVLVLWALKGHHSTFWYLLRDYIEKRWRRDRGIWRRILSCYQTRWHYSIHSESGRSWFKPRPSHTKCFF